MTRRRKKARKASGPAGFVCSLDRSKGRKEKSRKAIKNGGNGKVTILASDAHLIRTIIDCIDTQPEAITIYGSENGNTADLLKALNGGVCALCGGQGWWITNMGEDADPCLECKGTGTKK